jgi:hypothetical protein
MYQKLSVLSNPVGRRVRDYQGTISPDGGCDCLRETEIGILEERKLKMLILADRHQCSCGIETLRMNKSSTLRAMSQARAKVLHPPEERRRRGK